MKFRMTEEEFFRLGKVFCLAAVDFIILIIVIVIVIPFRDFYVPWEAKVYGHQRTNVRAGPSTAYEIVDQLEVGEIVPIVGQTGDWYYLSLDPKRMVREDTMEAVPSTLRMLLLNTVSHAFAQPLYLVIIFWLWLLQLLRGKVRRELFA